MFKASNMSAQNSGKKIQSLILIKVSDEIGISSKSKFIDFLKKMLSLPKKRLSYNQLELMPATHLIFLFDNRWYMLLLMIVVL